MSDIEKQMLPLKVIILVLNAGIFVVAGVLAYFSFGFEARGAGAFKHFPIVVSMVPAALMIIGSLMIKLVFFPLIENNKDIKDIEKYFAKRIAFLGIFEGAVLLGQVAILLLHRPVTDMPAWAYINYVYIVIFLFVGYKCWPRPQAATSETFGGDLVGQRQADNEFDKNTL